MNEKQYDILSAKLIKSTKQRGAVRLHLLGGLSAYEAEKQVYGDITSTVRRDAKRIKAEFEYIQSVALIGALPTKDELK